MKLAECPECGVEMTPERDAYDKPVDDVLDPATGRMVTVYKCIQRSCNVDRFIPGDDDPRTCLPDPEDVARVTNAPVEYIRQAQREYELYEEITEKVD